MNTTGLQIVDVPISADVVVPCPALRFQPLRAANGRPKCPHFQGVAQMSSDGSWDKKYVIRCSHVMERRTQIIQVIEELPHGLD